METKRAASREMTGDFYFCSETAPLLKAVLRKGLEGVMFSIQALPTILKLLAPPPSSVHNYHLHTETR